jgi:hypothetical protein
MQNRVLPFSFAFRAASRTGSSSSRREAVVGVEYRADWEQYEPVQGSNYVVRTIIEVSQSSEQPPAGKNKTGTINSIR